MQYNLCILYCYLLIYLFIHVWLCIYISKTCCPNNMQYMFVVCSFVCVYVDHVTNTSPIKNKNLCDFCIFLLLWIKCSKMLSTSTIFRKVPDRKLKTENYFSSCKFYWCQCFGFNFLNYQGWVYVACVNFLWATIFVVGIKF